MDSRPLFQALAALADDNATFFQQRGGAGGRRLADAFTALRDHAARLEPALRHVARLCHLFDLDEATPGNGYRSLVQTARCCLAHALHKSRCVAAQRRSLFFRAAHNAAELEAYGAALAQLRALLGLAQRLLARNRPGCLFPPEGDGLAQLVLREYSTMHNACFYGRCLGFQFAPSIRPLLQTIAIGLVSYGESYRRNETGLGGAAGSLFTSGKFALDPELRGAEFERVTQNLDVQFWKRFWNLTESELLASVASMAAAQVGVCRALTVPPEPLELPLEADPKVTVTIAPPVAHTGPGPVHMRLLSYQLREGQDSPALTALTRAEGSLGPLRWWRGPPLPPSPALLVHFHGGGFVAQTSRSHEPYLRGWARDLGVPILSVDYALAPEAPFPRALEECFYAYCWALRHCHLLGSTAQRVCLAGDSAGGNLCLAVALRAGAVGVRPPQGLVVAYPVTLVQAAPSPSRLLALLDPLLPLSVLCACLGAYAGTEEEEEEEKEEEGEGKTAPPPPEPLSPLRLLRDLRQGAAAWLGGLLQAPPPRPEPALTAEGAKEEQPPDNPPPEGRDPPEAGEGAQEDPDTFQPLRSRGPPARFLQRPSPLARNPLVSPLLAPDPLLCTLPPLHLVACALDPMLDDSVALARRLRGLGRPVTLRVVPDLPHGFLSLGPLSAETRRATALCTRLIRSVLAPPEPPRRGSLLVGARRDSLAPLDPSRRGSVMLGLRKDSLTPLETPRRGSVMLGSRRNSLIPSETPRRDSLIPLDSSRRGSVMLGFRRDSLATSETPRRGSMLVGSPKDSLAPSETPQQQSVLVGSPKDSLAPQDPPQQGSVMLGSPKDSLDPQDTPHQGSMLVGSHEDSLVAPETARRGSMVSGSHEDTSATHGGGIAATPGTAEARPPIRGLPPASGPPHGAPAQPPPCCGTPAEAGGASLPGQGFSGVPPVARRPSGPAGREVGS